MDRLTKPRVSGLQKMQDFDSPLLVEGGIGSTQVYSSLVSGDEINTSALEPLLGSSIRSKRKDVAVDSTGDQSMIHLVTFL